MKAILFRCFIFPVYGYSLEGSAFWAVIQTKGDQMNSGAQFMSLPMNLDFFGRSDYMGLSVQDFCGVRPLLVEPVTPSFILYEVT